jgi:hypothetical protein
MGALKLVHLPICNSSYEKHLVRRFSLFSICQLRLDMAHVQTENLIILNLKKILSGNCCKKITKKKFMILDLILK